MQMTLWRSALLSVALGMAIVGSAGGQMALQEAGVTIDRLLGLPHGLERLAPEDAERLRRVLATPELYMPALQREIALDHVSPGDEAEAVLRFNRAVSLLSAIGNQDARLLLRKAYRDARDRALRFPSSALSGEQRDRQADFGTSAKLVLVSLGRLGDPALVPECLERIGQEELPTQVVMLRYLEDVAFGDMTVAGRLEAIATDRSSRLYQAPILLRSIERIRGTR